MKFLKLHRFANLEIFIAANNVKVDCEGEFKINESNILTLSAPPPVAQDAF